MRNKALASAYWAEQSPCVVYKSAIINSLSAALSVMAVASLAIQLADSVNRL